MKKTFSLIGMVVGAAFALFGFIALVGAPSFLRMPNLTSYYDAGYASFGADFYTFVTNNAAGAAYGATAAAHNVATLTKLFGIAAILFGLVVLCAFGIVYSSCPNEPAVNFADEENECADEQSIENDA